MSGDYRVLFRRTGGVEVLEREAVTLSPPGPGEALVRHEAIGLNFIDTYHRKGIYPLDLPSGIGSEAAGVVEAVGPDVDHVSVGDRVAYAGGPLGAYATARVMPAALLIRLPDAIDARTAAAAMLKGMTADMLVGACGKVEPGQTVLVHAAAGGVGSLLVQWLVAIGAIVIAHTGTAEKAERARALGAQHALSCPFDDLPDAVRSIVPLGAALVLDGVGQESWTASLRSVAKRGLIVTYGNASGPVPPVPPLDLMKAGSIYLTRPTMGDYTSTMEERTASADRLFAMIESGKVRIDIGAEWPLSSAADAHMALEARATTGSTILLP